MVVSPDSHKHSINHAMSNREQNSIGTLSGLSAKKLLSSKWTAVTPIDKEKHFVVTRVEIEAVYSKRVCMIPWRELQDTQYWKRGWV
jgi:tryptophan-rich hypothetical protein